jgi:hypothetical protein
MHGVPDGFASPMSIAPTNQVDPDSTTEVSAKAPSFLIEERNICEYTGSQSAAKSHKVARSTPVTIPTVVALM